MTRRTPGGQRPARRPDLPARAGVRGREVGARGGSRYAPRGVVGSRPASRPAAARRAAAGGTAKRVAAPQPRWLTGRVTTVVAVLVTLALAYTYPVRNYLNQQSEIARMEAEQAAQRAHIDALSQQAELWKDPEYIKIKAKERFYMVEEGEKVLLVVYDPEGAARDAGARSDAASRSGGPWYDRLWTSVQAADGAAR
ncbi:MAG TPA: septum formation initiator family protein [Micromonosporaceae bacterium]